MADPLVHCQRCTEAMPPPQLLEHVRLLHPDVDVEPVEAAVSEVNFWHVNYATLNRDGMYVYSWLMARDQLEARAMARMESERHGHATITNRAGLVATFVGGHEVQPVREDRVQESGS